LYSTEKGCHPDDHEVLKVVSEFNAQAGCRTPFCRFGTKNEGLAIAVAHHGTTYKRAEVVGFDEDEVIFSDGSRYPCDTVILCTGFKISNEFMQHESFEKWWDPNPRKLYKRVILPEVGAGIGFVGFARPAFGSFSPLIEMQARYYAAVVSGRIHLPPTEEMQEVALQQEQWENSFFNMESRRPMLVNYASYMKDMASIIGCEPPMRKLFFTDPKLWWKIVTGQLTPLQFRIFGPGSIKDARDRVMQIPTMPLPVLLYMASLYTISVSLSRVGFSQFKPLC